MWIHFSKWFPSRSYCSLFCFLMLYIYIYTVRVCIYTPSNSQSMDFHPIHPYYLYSLKETKQKIVSLVSTIIVATKYLNLTFYVLSLDLSALSSRPTLSYNKCNRMYLHFISKRGVPET